MLALWAHGLHLLLVVLGLVGVAYLLLPRHVPREAALTGRETRARSVSARGAARRDSSTWRGLAVVSSVVAAGAHAAVTPHHLAEAWFVGLFFVLVTLAQAAWACLVALDATDGRLLVAGIVGSLGLICLWTASRTAGLPLGLGREPVGGWDLACGFWELVVIGTSWVGLHRPRAQRALVIGPHGTWLWTWAATSGLVLVALSLTEAPH
jgi:hypothetical protein